MTELFTDSWTGRLQGFSARAYDKVVPVARTFADLEGTERIEDRHIDKAIQYRNLDWQVL